MKTFKKVISFLILFSIVINSICINSYAETVQDNTSVEIYPFEENSDVTYTSNVCGLFEGAPYSGKDCTKNKTAQAAIDYSMNYYQDGDLFEGPGQCWGYAEYIRELMGGGGYPKYYQKIATNKLLKKALKGCKPGTHVRFSSNKEGGGGSHSVVVFKFTDKEVLYADNNWGFANRVHYYKTTPNNFGFGYSYLYFVYEPEKFVKESSIRASAAFDTKTGAINVAWPLVKGAKKYEIYRSNKKNGKYKKIATIKDASYYDYDTPVGKTVYYKVKVKGKGKKSTAVSAKRGLMNPHVKYQILGSGKVKLSWEPVEGATQYTIYNDYSMKKKLATIKGTEWIVKDSSKSNWFNSMYLIIRAESKKPKIKSIPTEIKVIGGPKQPELEVDKDYDDEGDNQIYFLEWNYYHYGNDDRDSDKEYYEVYRSDSKDGNYEMIAQVDASEETFYDKDNSDSDTYYYKIRYVGIIKEYKNGKSKNKLLKSAFSNVVSY
ncbi:hypothetical protein SAMN06297422_104136 [Lachnospiraceae bacterium]|nr:hypothetical protein SAMN06297422_104136 [Lachnospiraceae bacterium]